MAKKLTLSFLDIVMGAEAETIKAAYEAKVKIDEQLMLREEAYRRIAEIEDKIEEIAGVKGEFVFPAPPLPVAGIAKPAESTKAVTGKGKDRPPQEPKRKPEPTPESAEVETPEDEMPCDDEEQTDVSEPGTDTAEPSHSGRHHPKK
jgi:hypothetical protein